MSNTTPRKPRARKRAAAPGFQLGEFQPLASLWTGDAAPYPSEQSARWELRTLRRELAEAGALALHRGRLFVHPQRLAAVLERAAVERVRARVASAEGGA
jgi:hypothetical protein